MGVDVALVNEAGAPITSVLDVHDLVDRAIAELSADSNTLQFIDPYGDTTLNSLQIPRFLEDWQRAKGLVASEQDRRTWQEIADLARRVTSEPHVYLRFVGD